MSNKILSALTLTSFGLHKENVSSHTNHSGQGLESNFMTSYRNRQFSENKTQSQECRTFSGEVMSL